MVRYFAWLRAHRPAVAIVCAVGIAVVFALDILVRQQFMAGLYVLPLAVLAVSMSETIVAGAVVLCLLLMTVVLGLQGYIRSSESIVLLYGALGGGFLVILAYLLERLNVMSDYAILRAQLSEAGADIIGSRRSPDELDELLQYSLERLGEQLQATGGALLLLEDGIWVGRAGFGLGVDARAVAAPFAGLPLAADILHNEVSVVRDISGADKTQAGPLAAHLRLERVLLVPLRALDHDVGVLVLNRPLVNGEFSREQIELAEYIGRYVAVAIENVRLMVELDNRRHDLELVRDSSLDFAQSLDMTEVLEAVVMRLIDALDMHACDVYEVDEQAGSLRMLVSYDDQAFDQGEWTGREFSFEQLAASATAVQTRRPVVIASPRDERLSDYERSLMERWGHRTLLSIPLRIRDRVIALVELLDQREGRVLTAEQVDLARTICRFAALAVDKARLFDEQRATAERRDRLARRLQRLQSFAVDLNRRLDRAEPDEVADEIARAALDLVRVRAAGVVSGTGDALQLSCLQVASGVDPVAAERSVARRCHLALDLPEDLLAAGSEIVAPRLLQHDGLLLAPLEGDKPQSGRALVIADKESGVFDDEDRLLVETLAAQLSASLHNTIAYQREHAIAETFQTALLMDPPSIPGIEVGVVYRAATDASRVGGDFYDLVSLGPGRLLVTVGDVCGKSLGAAAQSAVVRYMLRGYAAEGSPGEALSRLNAAIIAQGRPGQPFVTLVAAYVDVARHMFEYASAGHPRPVVLAGHGEFPMTDDGHLPVGIFRGTTYPTNRAILPDDACIVFYTDGITDARRDGKLFGESGVRETVKRLLDRGAQELAEGLLDAVLEYAGGVLADDCAVVVLRLP